MFTYDDPERGLRVLNMAVPFGDPGVTRRTTPGTRSACAARRATTSRIDDVFVPDEKVLADRPYGVVDPPLQVIVSIAFSIISGRVPRRRRVGAATHAVDAVADRGRRPDRSSARSA